MACSKTSRALLAVFRDANKLDISASLCLESQAAAMSHARHFAVGAVGAAGCQCSVNRPAIKRGGRVQQQSHLGQALLNFPDRGNHRGAGSNPGAVLVQAFECGSGCPQLPMNLRHPPGCLNQTFDSCVEIPADLLQLVLRFCTRHRSTRTFAALLTLTSDMSLHDRLAHAARVSLISAAAELRAD